MTRPSDRRMARIKKRLAIKQARLQIAEQKHHNKRIGRLKKRVDILNNKNDILELRKALSVKRAERKQLRH